MNLFKIDEHGNTIKQVAYADSPHVARGEARWFHVHNKDNHEILSEIATPGFQESAVPAVLTWAKEYLKKSKQGP